MSQTPIADHALLSDRHSSALVDTAGSVEWLCCPRFDSPSVFGRLLGAEAGHWQVRPTGEWTSTRRYLDRTLVLETTFTSGTGTLVVTDLLAVGEDNGGHRLGTDVPHLLVRRLECTSGSVEVEVDYRPRPEYGLVVPLLDAVDGGVTARGGAEWLVLTTPVDLELVQGRGAGRTVLTNGETCHLALHRSTLEQTPARVWSQPELATVVDRTVEAWRSWSGLHQSYDGPWADLVHHSGRVLQGLSFQPSGAIVAAATTSLPESVGGERNWDYRYSWVRDASFTMEALWVAACPDEADDFFAFLTTAAASAVGPGQSLQIMFGVGGEHDLTERELPHLEGWCDSRPVRVGNGAWDQTQIDVYGEMLGAAYAARRPARRHRRPDQGLPRRLRGHRRGAVGASRTRASGRYAAPPRHFLYSKVMCWVALDRAIRLADVLGADRPGGRAGPPPARRSTAPSSRTGGATRRGPSRQYVGSDDLDASNLMMPIVGFLPADDPRMLATVDATEQRLTDGRGLVYRYRTEGGVDGLAGDEGTFLLCTFWLAQALALSGQVERATAVFERAAAFANDVGLLAEEVDAGERRAAGQLPAGVQSPRADQRSLGDQSGGLERAPVVVQGVVGLDEPDERADEDEHAGEVPQAGRSRHRRLLPAALVELADLGRGQERDDEPDEERDQQGQPAAEALLGVPLHLVVDHVVPDQGVDPQGDEAQQHAGAGVANLADRSGRRLLRLQRVDLRRVLACGRYVPRGRSGGGRCGGRGIRRSGIRNLRAGHDNGPLRWVGTDVRMSMRRVLPVTARDI